MATKSNLTYSVGVGICVGALTLGALAKYPLLTALTQRFLTKKDTKEEEQSGSAVDSLSIQLPCQEEDSSVSSDNVNTDFMTQACTLATKNLEKNTGGPFGCVIVRDGKIIGQGANSVTTSKDPTCHAEMNAIRDACKNVDDFQLDGAVCFTSCEPCPMCYAALRWARIDHIYFANTRKDAHDIGFSDQDIYDEIEKKSQKMERLNSPVAKDAFIMWDENTKFTRY